MNIPFASATNQWALKFAVKHEKYTITYLQVVIFLNLLAPELFFKILAHTVYKMWIKQEPNTLQLWNKLHFEGEKAESIYLV